jgi:tetratricopeptide (TPR) repeat protein
LAQTAELGILAGIEQARWLDCLETEHDNVRSALAWALERDASLALQLAEAMGPFWYVRSHLSEGRQWLERALAAGGPVDRRTRGNALHGLAALTAVLGNHSRAVALFQEALPLQREVGDHDGVAWSLHGLAAVASIRGDLQQAMMLHEEELELRRRVADSKGIAHALGGTGRVATALGDHERGKADLEEALRLYRGAGGDRPYGLALANLGSLMALEGDHDRAVTLFQEAQDLFEHLGAKGDMAETHLSLGLVAEELGERVQAARSYAAALTLFQETEEQVAMISGLGAVAGLAAAAGEARAVRLFGAEATHRKALGFPLSEEERERSEHGITALRERLGDRDFAAAWEAGGALPLQAAVAEALALTDELMAGDDAATERGPVERPGAP